MLAASQYYDIVFAIVSKKLASAPTCGFDVNMGYNYDLRGQQYRRTEACFRFPLFGRRMPLIR